MAKATKKQIKSADRVSKIIRKTANIQKKGLGFSGTRQGQPAKAAKAVTQRGATLKSGYRGSGTSGTLGHAVDTAVSMRKPIISGRRAGQFKHPSVDLMSTTARSIQKSYNKTVPVRQKKK